MSHASHAAEAKKQLLKHLILQLHEGEAPEQVKQRLLHVLQSIPYNDVVEVEQELISEGLPVEEVLRLCDIHTMVLDGSIDTSQAQVVPEGHPVDVFIQENKALTQRIQLVRQQLEQVAQLAEADIPGFILGLRTYFNELSDVDKHYLRKEYLLFPFLEKVGITGPPTVMWGKHDETRAYLKAVHEALRQESLSKEELQALVPLVFNPALEAIEGMIMKEEEILLPMSMDALEEENWQQIQRETTDYGYCLIDPKVLWKSSQAEIEEVAYLSGSAIRLSSGNFSMEELEALFVTLPIDITFVDKDDKVKFFSHSPKRVFERNRAIIGRDVRMCHPPHSVHMVEQILIDFKSGKENKAAFWMSNFKGRFIYIEYTALRGPEQEYLGVIEVTQDITGLRSLQGDQRLLSYDQK